MARLIDEGLTGARRSRASVGTLHPSCLTGKIRVGDTSRGRRGRVASDRRPRSVRAVRGPTQTLSLTSSAQVPPSFFPAGTDFWIFVFV